MPKTKPTLASAFVKTCATLGLTTALLAAATAPAKAEPARTPGSTGVEFGLRLGYGMPFGEVVKDSKLDGIVAGQVPLILEAAYRLNPRVLLGGLFQYGFAQIKDRPDACNAQGNSCSMAVVRLGANVIYRFLLGQKVVPFVGAGIGYEWLSVDRSTSNVINGAGYLSYRGIEFLNLQAGGDFRVAPKMVIGPFVTLSMGRYATSTGKVAVGPLTATEEYEIKDTGIHQWLMLGVRGAFSL